MPEYPYEESLLAFDIQSRGWDELHQEVSRSVSARPLWNCPPLSTIVQLLVAQDCTSAVLQSPIRDDDFDYDFLHAGGRSSRDCARIHFFGGPSLGQGAQHELDLEELSRYDATREGYKVDDNPYLGSVVIRPTGNWCVGKTVIRFPLGQDTLEGNPHACANYRTDLCGYTLQVFGSPFMQQDRSSHACASASLWTLCYDLHRRYNTPRRFPRQVTEIATQGVSHGRPILEGLSPSEICRMLSDLECAVDLQWIRLGNEPDRQKKLRAFVATLYGYVHSNLPVLVGYWSKNAKNPSIGHVVLAIGHDLCDEVQTPGDAFSPDENRPLLSSDYVSSFVVQDDQRGPYKTLNIWSTDANTTGTNGEEIPPLETAERVFLAPGLTGAAGLLFGITLDLVYSALEREFFAGIMTSEDEVLMEATRVRLYFQQLRRFKKQLLSADSGRVPLPLAHRNAYQRLILPADNHPPGHYVYVCDLCIPDPDTKRRFRVWAEIVIDATAGLYDAETSVVAMRIKNELYLRGANAPIIANDYKEHPFAPSNLGDWG